MICHNNRIAFATTTGSHSPQQQDRLLVQREVLGVANDREGDGDDRCAEEGDRGADSLGLVVLMEALVGLRARRGTQGWGHILCAPTRT